MDLLLKLWALVLFLSGLPVFVFGIVMLVGGELGVGHNDPRQVEKTLLLLIVVGCAGLLTAAGCCVWALTRIAYSSRGRRGLPFQLPNPPGPTE
jgi:hypothetical protein